MALTQPQRERPIDGDGDGDVDTDADGDGDGDSDGDSDGEVLCTYYRDNDGDTFGDPDSAIESPCGDKGSYVENDLDCDDTNSDINPNAVEVCDDVDNNCDGEINEGVLNACGFCGPEPEEVCDGEDNDCDGEIDEGFDADGDGFTACDGDCDDENDLVYPDALELCDGLDNNCDASGWIDEGIGFCYVGASSIREEGEVDVLDDSSLSSNDSLAYDIDVNDVVGSLVFDGGSSFAELAEPIGRPDLVDVTEFTVAFWIDGIPPVEGASVVLGRGRSCTASMSWEVLLFSNGRLKFTWSSDGSTQHGLDSTSISGRHHVVFTIQGGVVVIYLDGVRDVADDTYAGEEPLIPSRRIRIGIGWCDVTSTSGSAFAGELDGIYFYPRALSEPEVATLYDSYL